MRVLLVVFTLLLAGCAAAPSTPEPRPPSTSDAFLAQLRAAPAPALDGAGVLAWLRTFSESYAPRFTGSPGERMAGDELAGQLQALGYEVEDRRYGANGARLAEGPLRAIVATKPGATLPDEIVALGAHYDSLTQPSRDDTPDSFLSAEFHAAYDNGSGTAAVVELARLLAGVPLDRTLVLVLFNGEEEGVLASEAFVQESATANIVAYFDFDMVGIAYPSPGNCLWIVPGNQPGSAELLMPLIEPVAFEFLGLPRGKDLVDIFEGEAARSDDAAFAGAGFATARWRGLPSAEAYWAYHKVNDTVETMVAQAGGEDLLAQGMENTIATAYYSVIAVDASRR